MENRLFPDKIMKKWTIAIKFTGIEPDYWNKYGYSATLWKRKSDAWNAYINRSGKQFIQ